jgi:glycosyltransferase involved in cell wall biosynthesis
LPEFPSGNIWRQRYLNLCYFNLKLKKSNWIIQEIVEANKIEPIIQTKQYKHISPVSYAQENSSFLESLCLFNVLKQYGKNTNFCIFMPFIGRGGAEKIACRHIREVAKNKDAHITIFTTEKLEYTAKRSLPPDVNIIHLEDILDDDLTLQQKIRIISALLIRYKPGKIYSYNNSLFFEALSKYGKEICRHSKIYASMYALSFTKKTKEMWGDNTDYISKIFPYVANIITDNLSVINELSELCALDKEKFICNYSYVDLHENVPAFKENSFNIFWASRICREKRLDILLEIVKKCEKLPIAFHIFGSGDSNKSLNKLKKLSNVKYRGEFDGFDSIVNPDFDAFLYTSESDGIPNVLLEAMSYGYAAIAPNVGGISEAVNEKTGFLIENYQDVDAYVEVIKKLALNKNVLKEKQTHIKELLESKFNKERFVSAMKQIGML